MTALALSMGGLSPRPGVIVPRVGTPRRGAILTALAAAAVAEGNLRAVLLLARTGRPRSMIRCQREFRYLALEGLMALYPEANQTALRATLGCRPHLTSGRPADRIAAVARDVATYEDAAMTARWVWPEACAVAADHTGAQAGAVAQVTGSRGCQPRAVSEARKIAVYLTMTEGDVNVTAMATATGLHKTTVMNAVAQIEDRRETDAALDAALETLAETLRARLDEELSQC